MHEQGPPQPEQQAVPPNPEAMSDGELLALKEACSAEIALRGLVTVSAEACVPIDREDRLQDTLRRATSTSDVGPRLDQVIAYLVTHEGFTWEDAQVVVDDELSIGHISLDDEGCVVFATTMAV